MRASKSPIAVLTVVLLSSWATCTAAFAATNSAANVVPPQAKVGGLTQAQWSARQWAWQIEAPSSPADDPVIDANAGTPAAPEPVDCTLRQSGHVWFLAGATFFQNYTTAYRSCTIPAGKFLFFPLFDAWQDNLNCPGSPSFTLTADDLRAAVAGQIDQIVPGSMQVTVDGQSVKGLDDSSTAFRAQADGFSYSLPSDNELGPAFCNEPFAAGTTPPAPGAFADGVYVMLPPLSVGTHQLAFAAASSNGATEDVHYTISVAS